MHRVAVVTRKTLNSNYNETYNSISDNWLDFFNELNIEPVFLTDKIKNPISYFKKLNCSCLFLLNGEDTKLKINKKKFKGGTNRDFIEFKLLNYCLQQNIPILGICRGHQFINIYFGGKIKKIDNHVNKKHKIKIIDKSYRKIFKRDYFLVNSFHNYGIYKDDLSKELIPWAVAEDTIEGFYNKNYKILSMMWHPERRRLINKYELKLISDLLQK